MDIYMPSPKQFGTILLSWNHIFPYSVKSYYEICVRAHSKLVHGLYFSLHSPVTEKGLEKRQTTEDDGANYS